MTKEEAKHLSEVLKAYGEGKEIQVMDITEKNCKWLPTSNINTSVFGLKYRIKPEIHYTHYRNAKEFLEAQKEHGPYVWFSDGVYNIPKSVITMGDRVLCEFETPAYRSMNSIDLLDYRWQDGTVCGIKIEV